MLGAIQRGRFRRRTSFPSVLDLLVVNCYPLGGGRALDIIRPMPDAPIDRVTVINANLREALRSVACEEWHARNRNKRWIGHLLAEMLKFVAHSHRVLRIAIKYGWLPGARYTNLRDVREFDRLGFLDIDWANYDFRKHLAAARSTRPLMTVARDILNCADLDEITAQADRLSEYVDTVIVVPKDRRLGPRIDELIPQRFLLGYSVRTRYGGTSIPLRHFTRPVHLLGGRPEIQRRLAENLQVRSLDCNRFTLDAAFGDFFDGEIFRPHPIGGYERCVRDSIHNISALWDSYQFKAERCVRTSEVSSHVR